MRFTLILRQKFIAKAEIMKQKMHKVILLHNIVAPYRLPLFKDIGKHCDLLVLFCSQIAENRSWDLTIGPTTFRYKFLKKLRLGFFILNPGILPFLLTHKADVYVIIDNEENFFSNIFTVYLAKLFKRPYVLWSGHIPTEAPTIHPIDFHGGIFHKPIFKRLINVFFAKSNQYLYKNAASFLAYSPTTKRYLIKHGVKNSKIVVGTQAMSQTLLPEVSEMVKLNRRKLQLLYIGYLRPEKGINTLIDAIHQLDSSKVDLHIVGEGPQLASLKKLANSRDNIFFHSYANSKERANWYATADLTVLPTFYDPWAHTVTESLYYGTPVVVTSSAAASTVIRNGKNGYVFTAGDSGELVSIVRTLSKQKANAMKQYIRSSNQSRLYNVSADADNFGKAISLAVIN
jgi:glycosyltransferase involved in cell wall biosynthesis